MQHLFRVVMGVFVVMVLSVSSALAYEVRLSSTIGPVDAGILPLLMDTWSKKTGNTVYFEKAGTGATLEKAKTGSFDLVMVHARRLEDAFVADGFGVNRRDVMYNDFVILGPQADPAGIKGMQDAAQAFKVLAEKQLPFVTRGDKSGTHIKEMEVWEKAGIKPAGAWYEVYTDGARGNKATTVYSNEKQAYVLMDRATYLTVKNDITLQPLLEGDTILLNFIAVITINPKKFEAVNYEGAEAFAQWLVSEEAQAIIKSFGVDTFGEPLFFPNAQANVK